MYTTGSKSPEEDSAQLTILTEIICTDTNHVLTPVCEDTASANLATYEAFEMCTLHDLPAPEVAERLGMTHAAVRKACEKVKAKVAEELLRVRYDEA